VLLHGCHPIPWRPTFLYAEDADTATGSLTEASDGLLHLDHWSPLVGLTTDAASCPKQSRVEQRFESRGTFPHRPPIVKLSPIVLPSASFKVTAWSI
jgi:hypothetical protein